MKSFSKCLYFVTPEIGNDFSAWENLIYNALEGGIGMLQLRDKTCDSQTFIEAARRIQPMVQKAGIPLIINDRVDIAQAVGADGVHVGQSDASIEHARSVLGKNAIIGLSVENLDQATQAEELDVTYLAASPVFPTQTKQNCHTPWGLTHLQYLCVKSRHPIFGIGGIHLENVSSVLECGVCGVAVVSAISSAYCPKEATQALLRKMKG